MAERTEGDEDTLQISSESADEEADAAHGSEESSGAHINDALNMPDAQGRVLVNINHPPEEKDIYLAPQLARAVKPHQIGGIRFLYDNLIESLDRYKTSSGFGCILAHSMGLGKTLQVISFIDILLRNTEAHTVLAIVPNWLTEFNLWLPPQEALPPDTDPTCVTGRMFKVHILNDEHKYVTCWPIYMCKRPRSNILSINRADCVTPRTTLARAKVVEEWSRDGGVLLMGYEMYRLLSMKKSFVMGKKRKTKKPAGPVIIDLDEEDRQQELMKGIEKAIARPGPDVVICDEGHRIKNYHASTSQALKNIRSRRRVVLTGYPLQNNLTEYWCMVDFVRPDFLGTRQEFSNMFERPILNGQCVDSTPQDVRLMRYRSHVLHSLLEGFVQRRGHDVLRHHLPNKEEFVILVRLSPIQKALYTEFMKRFREAGNSGWLGLNPLKAFCVCCKIWNHPDVLYEALQKENLANEQDLDLDDITSASNPRCPAPNAGLKTKVADSSNSKVNNSLPPLNPSQDRANQVITYEWVAGCLGVNLIGASRVVVFDASWNPCHDAQAVCRVYRYGQRKPCYIYRLVCDFTLEKKIYDRQVSKQGMSGRKLTFYCMNRFKAFTFSESCNDFLTQKSRIFLFKDRVVDDLNPVLNFTRKEVESLLHFVEEEPMAEKISQESQRNLESVIYQACELYPNLITKVELLESYSFL
ncbi:hypothetical protein GOODEAATRI_005839 [Goodea atripinnis]|uniref:Helicase ATP-binding domain-containing protein n=1 Tax=Goodea atripinnis TaxID=208336 RepID=A0ABV0N8A1_9TELE